MISSVDLRTMELLRGEISAAALPQSLASWQMAQVRALIPYIKRNSRFYAEKLADVDETRLREPADLASLPFTYPHEVRADPESFLCVLARDVRRIATIHTSGSTGDPKRFFFTENDLERTLDFFSNGMLSLTGPGKRVEIMLSSDVPDSIAFLLRTALERIGAEAHIHGHIFDVDRAAEAVGAADCLVGLPAELIRLCRSYPKLRPESVLLTADYVPQAIAGAMESTWRCRTFSHYGMTETGYGCAVQCDRGEAHHVRHADVLLEIIDPLGDMRLGPGEVGEVVVTTFVHEAMPLLRYRTGDLASIVAEPCPCGGVLPRLGRVKGRIGDIAELGNGAWITPGELDEIIYRCDGIRDYRAKILRRSDDTVLSIAVDAEERARGMLGRLLCDYLPQGTALDITCTSLPSSEGVRKRRIEAEHSLYEE